MNAKGSTNAGRPMNAEKLIKSTQEQAVASWIGYLNVQRMEELLHSLSRQDVRLEDALRELEELKQSINRLVASDRGGIKGMHGFIAERMQVYFENARSLLDGAGRGHYLIDDNGPVDYIGHGINYQQKFVEKHLSRRGL